MRRVDLKMKALVDAMTETDRIQPSGAREGSASGPFRSPNVLFHCELPTAAALSRVVRAASRTGILSHSWEITAEFDYEHRLAFTIQAPELAIATGRFARLWRYGVRRRLIDRDLWELAKLVRETLGSAKADGGARC